jgi:hypothetical protein
VGGAQQSPDVLPYAPVVSGGSDGAGVTVSACSVKESAYAIEAEAADFSSWSAGRSAAGQQCARSALQHAPTRRSDSS